MANTSGEGSGGNDSSLQGEIGKDGKGETALDAQNAIGMINLGIIAVLIEFQNKKTFNHNVAQTVANMGFLGLRYLLNPPGFQLKRPEFSFNIQNINIGLEVHEKYIANYQPSERYTYQSDLEKALVGKRTNNYCVAYTYMLCFEFNKDIRVFFDYQVKFLSKLSMEMTPGKDGLVPMFDKFSGRVNIVQSKFNELYAEFLELDVPTKTDFVKGHYEDFTHWSVMKFSITDQKYHLFFDTYRNPDGSKYYNPDKFSK